MSELSVHPLAARFPKMSAKEFAELKESIATHGLFEPIVINSNGEILDGRHRHKALVELGLSITHVSIPFDDVRQDKPLTEEQFIYESNIRRRHLTDDQRVMLAADFAPYFRQEAEERKSQSLPKAREAKAQKSVNTNSCSQKRDTKTMHANSTVGVVAKQAKISHYKAAQAIAVAKDPALASQVASGEKPLSAAAKEIRAQKAKEQEPSRLAPEASRENIITFDHEPKAPEVTEGEKIIRRFEIWVKALAKEKHISGKEIRICIAGFLKN